jgi:hypothetical protein
MCICVIIINIKNIGNNNKKQENNMSEKEMLSKRVWAVVGANRNPEKYGNMIYRRLKEKNYVVYAVNPSCDTVDGDPCYASLSALPQKPDVINMVVAPKRGEAYLREAAEIGIQNVWFQPGTHDDSIMTLAEELGLRAVQACVLVVTKWFEPAW